MSKAKEFYRTMWNPIYEDTDHPQFSYKELIEFAEEYKEHCNESQKSAIPIVSDSDCCHPSIMYINSKWKFFCVECGQTGIESDR